MAIEFGRLDQAHDRSRTLTRPQRSGKQPVLATERDRTHLVLDPVVVDGQLPIVQEARERLPSPQAVVNGPCRGRAIRHPGSVFAEPGVQLVHNRSAVLLAHTQPFLSIGVRNEPLHLIELPDLHQGLFGYLALVGRVQLKELAPRMRPASGLRDVFAHELLVARKVIDQQRAAPALEEFPSVFARAAFAEVVHHGLEVFVPPRGVSPQGGAVRLAIALTAALEHLHRGLVGVHDAVRENLLAQRIHQRLQLHTAAAHPLRQGRARQRHPGAGIDRFLAVQGQVVSVLGHQHLRQQAGSGPAPCR